MPAVTMTVNGVSRSADVEGRTLLVDFLREQLALTGTHVGCDTSQCGACVVHMNGQSVKSCTCLAVDADGADVTTIEGLANAHELHPLQEKFEEHGALQCGFCGPGMLISAKSLLDRNPQPTVFEVRDALSGNLCRCTGYTKIIEAVIDAGHVMRSEQSNA